MSIGSVVFLQGLGPTIVTDKARDRLTDHGTPSVTIGGNSTAMRSNNGLIPYLYSTAPRPERLRTTRWHDNL